MAWFQLSGAAPDWASIEAVGVCLGALATFAAFVTAFVLQRRQFRDSGCGSLAVRV